MKKKSSVIFTTLSLIFSLYMTSAGFAQSPLSPGEHMAKINGNTVHYFVSGKGPVCLFPSPGWGISVDYIKPQATFEKYFTMVYYDTRLSGLSTGPDDATKYADIDFINDADALRAYLKQPKIWIAGHSAGGYLVLDYAIHHNDKLFGLIAIDAIAVSDSIYQAEFKKMILQRKNVRYYVEHKELYKTGEDILLGKDTTTRSLRNYLENIITFYFHDPRKAIMPSGTLTDKVMEYTTKSHYIEGNLLPQLKHVTVPTLIIVGDDDFICDPISQAGRIHVNIKSSQLSIIKDCGHLPWFEQPESYAEVCDKWLKLQKTGGGK